MLLFINVHVSAFYSSIAKDRLYHFSLNSLERRSAQTICFEVTFFFAFFHYSQLLQFIIRVFAPIICHTMEEVYQHLNFNLKSYFQNTGSKIGFEPNPTIDSVFAHGFVKLVLICILVNTIQNEKHNFDSLSSTTWQVLMSIRDAVNKNLEAARVDK